jgi:hypothetical protein
VVLPGAGLARRAPEAPFLLSGVVGGVFGHAGAARCLANFIPAHEAPMLVNHLLPVGVQFAGRAVVNEAGCDGSPLGYCP